MDNAKFFDLIRPTFPLTKTNVEGFEFIIAEGYSRRVPLNDLAYILGTAWWETANTMQPVREAYWLSEAWRRKNLRYFPWYGRGYVQLTWEDNYKKAGKELGIDLLSDPDVVMKPEIAIKILFEGMQKGWFTGKSMRDYIDLIDENDAEDLREFTNARRIINGTDKAAIIGQLAIALEKALRGAGYEKLPTLPNSPEPSPEPPVAQPEPVKDVPKVEEVEEEFLITLRVSDLSKVTLSDFNDALNALKSGVK